MTRMTRWMVLGVFGFAAATACAQDAPKGSAERGKRLFVELNCYSCHGTHAQGGGRGSEPQIPAGYPWAAFLQELRVPQRDMPRYSEKWVSDQDVADLFAYFAAVPRAPAVKDTPLLRGF